MLPRRHAAEQPCRAAWIPTLESRSSILPSASGKLKVGTPAPIGFDSVTNGFSVACDKSGGGGVRLLLAWPQKAAFLPRPTGEDEPQHEAIPLAAAILMAACLHWKEGKKEDTEGIAVEKTFPLHTLLALAGSVQP